MILYRVNEKAGSHNTFIRAYWPRDNRRAAQALQYLQEFTNIEIELQVKQVDPLAFVHKKVIVPTDTGRYRARIGELYHIFNSIPENRVAVVEIFLS